ncbi:STM3941 family protein [Gaetbulibacter sp. NE]|jgi:hypothetical protein|uniref:STM3941 family protein n=1 Tax=Gaetbulibacter sp. NE TaxID=2982307 RepID=UPI003FA5D924
MYREFKFKKGKVLFGLIFYVLLLLIFISFLINPEIYIRKVFMTERSIIIIGIIGIIYSSSVLYSFIILLSRKYSIKITEEFLIDNSKYESLGKIEWKDISKIQRFKKNNIELTLNRDILKNKNLLKRFLTFMHNWNYNKSILISSALTDCNTEELFVTISGAYERNKLR